MAQVEVAWVVAMVVATVEEKEVVEKEVVVEKAAAENNFP